MRAPYLASLVALVAIPLLGDTRQVFKITAAGHETIYTEYIQGNNRRTESLRENSSQLQVSIRNFERKTLYEIDPYLREYVESSSNGPDFILTLAQWINRPPHTRRSGKTVNIYYETIDTGERKQFFGRTAKHLVVRERHVAEPGACESSYEMKKDGWYIPQDSSGPRALYRAYLITGDRGCSDTVLTHGNPRAPGIAVLETDGAITRQILELSNEPLDKSVFDVPAGFKHVDSLPWYRPMTSSERLELDWSQLERAVQSWFQ